MICMLDRPAGHENISWTIIKYYMFLLWLNFQRKKTKKAQVQFIKIAIVKELVLADLHWDCFQAVIFRNLVLL